MATLIISDPDVVVNTTTPGDYLFLSPIVVDVSTKTITITPGSGVLPLASDGITGQALYSAMKIVWKNSDSYIKYPFPMEAITPEQFDFINGWKLANDVTRKSLRTCGWSERHSGGSNISRKYMGVVSLGTLGATDPSYYQWNTDAKQDFSFPGALNEGIQIFGNATYDVASATFDYTDGGDTLKLFNRIQGKVYSSSNNGAIGANTLTYITYRFPLSNATDLKIGNKSPDSHISNVISGMTGLTGSGDGTNYTFTKTAHGFTEGGRIRITGATPATLNGVHTIVATGFTANTFAIASTETGALSAVTEITSIHGAITIDYLSGTETHDVNEDSTNETYKYIILDASSLATTQEIYEKMQYQLRQNSDISSGATNVNGTTADTIVTFVGDTLVGEPGVYINQLNTAYLNAVTYYSLGDTAKATPIFYPFIANGNINFGANAGTGDFKYWMFYKTLPVGVDNDYGEANAVIVTDKDGSPIAGTYSGTPIAWTFKYDAETAGGARTAGTNADVVVVGIGLDGGQFASVEHIINRTAGQSILLAPAQERNYSNP